MRPYISLRLASHGCVAGRLVMPRALGVVEMWGSQQVHVVVAGLTVGDEAVGAGPLRVQDIHRGIATSEADNSRSGGGGEARGRSIGVSRYGLGERRMTMRSSACHTHVPVLSMRGSIKLPTVRARARRFVQCPVFGD